MASIIGHFAAAFTIKKLVQWKRHTPLLIACLISSFLPDIDVLAFSFDIPYEHPFGHRGFTHSFVFALLWAGLLTPLFRKKKVLVFILLFLSTASHPILDAMTSGGLGVAFFAPFDNTRYFLPFRPIKVSPIGLSNFFSEWGWLVIKSEVTYVMLPCAAILVVKRLLKEYG